MRVRLKNLMTLISICSILFFGLCVDSVYAKTDPQSDFFVHLNADGNSDENTSELDFIKSNEEVINFLGDGWILLYGGISLVAISVAGIVFVLIPKKKRKISSKGKSHRQSNNDDEE